MKPKQVVSASVIVLNESKEIFVFLEQGAELHE